ncbi:CCA tRNA nucleotidyltransferase [Bacillus gibsonii]|nr:CCA tRNA nucleotidyltransferase [Alkalicoccobacillus gibsonii]
MNPLAKQAAAQVMNQLLEHGYRAHMVGGAVRDGLLQREVSDIDVTTSAKSAEICALFKRAHQMNTEHQTVLVRIGEMHIEVTTERGLSLAEDLASRDFTINSMAQTLEGEIIDPYNGQEDLTQKLIRSFSPEDRMDEDPLRMLRAIRFCSELTFLIDRTLLEVIKQKAPSIQHVAGERIVTEWDKLLSGSNLQQAFHYLKETELYSYLPGLHMSIDEIERLKSVPKLQNLDSVNRWVLYFLWIKKPSHSATQDLPLSNETKRQIKSRLTLFEYREQHPLTDWVLFQSSLSVVRDVEQLRRFFQLTSMNDQLLQEKWEALPIHSSKELKISGRDLMENRKIPSGPWIKEELEWLLRLVISRSITHSKAALLDAIERRRNDEK